MKDDDKLGVFSRLECDLCGEHATACIGGRLGGADFPSEDKAREAGWRPYAKLEHEAPAVCIYRFVCPECSGTLGPGAEERLRRRVSGRWRRLPTALRSGSFTATRSPRNDSEWIVDDLDGPGAAQRVQFDVSSMRNGGRYYVYGSNDDKDVVQEGTFHLGASEVVESVVLKLLQQWSSRSEVATPLGSSE